MSSAVLPSSDSPSAAYDSGFLEVGHGHRVYYEQAGRPDGIPAVLLHGGPGSGSSVRQREILDATRYRIVQFDQRGSGLSTPAGETDHNHTGALIEDIEKLREHLRIERWLVCGGSWGAALAFAYAARHRDRVSGVLVRGTFLTGHEDLDWFFHGVAALAPEAHLQFMQAIPRRWHRSVLTWLDRCFGRGDPRAAAVARAWQTYELRLSGDPAPPAPPAPPAAPSTSSPDDAASARLLAKYRVQAHYLERKCFLGEAAVLRAAQALRGMPVAIVHGTQDRICRPINAWRAHRACAGSRLAWARAAGHNPWHPAMHALTRGATDAFAAGGDFSGWPPQDPGA
jgi:proline iminopeptidase